MEETVLFPSPNWFQTSGFVVTCDEWIIYGGPTKSLCALEPLSAENDGILVGKPKFRAHVVTRAHLDRITCVAISPEWPEKREILAGSADGMVKQWTLEQIDQTWKLKPTQSHEKHHHEKEEVAGVAYSHDSYAITVGCFGNIWKWDIKSNVVKHFKQLKAFKPTCISCSPHIPLNVAIGTKQGVVVVLDLTGSGKVLYKVRGQDDEITTVGWCPQYEVLVKKALGEPESHPNKKDKKEKVSVATKRMMKIRELTDEQKLALSQMDTEEKTDEESDHEGNEVEVEIQDVKLNSETLEEDEKEKHNVLENSGIVKSLPEDSFDDTVVEEDDMFDIYKDHEADEFGHKKYQPEEILVKIKDEKKPTDYLDDCLKLKEEILKRKNQQEQSMESLVKALDDAHIEKTEVMPSTSQAQVSGESSPKENPELKAEIAKVQRERVDHSLHVHKHLLVSVGKYGSIRIWSKSGRLVGSCATQTAGKNQRGKSTAWTTALWYQADVLFIGDCKSQLLQCDPLTIDCKNKLEYRVVGQLHRRGLFCLSSGAAPRVWSAGQDRRVVCWDAGHGKPLAEYATCGGFLYDVKTCPYDAGKVAVSVSDGAVRVWETEACEDEQKLVFGRAHMHWQRVQGKVLCAAWHPSAEGLLAFATGESRVGLIEARGKDTVARPLACALGGGVYSLCWATRRLLYACGAGALLLYDAGNPDNAPLPVEVVWEGRAWQPSAVRWRADGLLVGALSGAVALLTPDYPHTVLAVAYVFTKMIHTMDWHPLQTSSSSEESTMKNLIAVCSLDKVNTVVILEYAQKEDGSKQLNTWKTLTGHTDTVLQVSWSPHDDEMLLSTSQDHTVRIWDVVSGACTHVFAGHSAAALSAAWCAQPALRAVLSAGGDACLRLWQLHQHPAAAYQERAKESHKKKKDKKQVKGEEATEQDDGVVATTQTAVVKGDKKFLMPVLTKQLFACSIQGARKMIKKYLEKRDGDIPEVEEEDMEQSYRVNYIKIFGSINEVNEVLDEELERHEDAGRWEAWVWLSALRGHIDATVQFAAARDMLCPELLSMAPCVSLKYWKDATQLYLAQIDRLIAKGEEHKLFVPRQLGGAVWRAVVSRLALHDVRGAVTALRDAQLYKEAYVLCRTRYMDSIAQETLQTWATHCFKTGYYHLAAVCQIALGNLAEAANYLSKSKDESWLGLAAEIAKIAGQNSFADHMLEKREQLKNMVPSDLQEELEQLPSRVELLMKEKAAEGTEDSAVKEQGQVNEDIKDDAVEVVSANESGQGDVKEEEPKGDLSKNIEANETGQGDVKEETSKADLSKEVKDEKEDINENDEVLNVQCEAVNKN